MASLTAFATLVVYSVVEQGRYRYWPSIQWPGDMSAANDIAWLALALIGSDLVAGWLRARPRPRHLR